MILPKQKTRLQIYEDTIKKWKLKYHELIFGKPSYDIYIDDKSIFFDKNWTEKLKKIKMKNLNTFLKNYNKKFFEISQINDDILIKIKKLYELILKIKKIKKIIIVGNGGSAAIASHFSVDMTKNGGVRCINFNESDLLTCFANDYGYENWVKEV